MVGGREGGREGRGGDKGKGKRRGKGGRKKGGSIRYLVHLDLRRKTNIVFHKRNYYYSTKKMYKKYDNSVPVFCVYVQYTTTNRTKQSDAVAIDYNKQWKVS